MNEKCWETELQGNNRKFIVKHKSTIPDGVIYFEINEVKEVSEKDYKKLKRRYNGK